MTFDVLGDELALGRHLELLRTGVVQCVSGQLRAQALALVLRQHFGVHESHVAAVGPVVGEGREAASDFEFIALPLGTAGNGNVIGVTVHRRAPLEGKPPPYRKADDLRRQSAIEPPP